MTRETVRRACQSLAELFDTQPDEPLVAMSRWRHAGHLDASWSKPNEAGFFHVKVVDWEDFTGPDAEDRARAAAEEAATEVRSLDEKMAAASTFVVACVTDGQVNIARLVGVWPDEFRVRCPDDTRVVATTMAELDAWRPGKSEGTWTRNEAQWPDQG